MMFEIHLQGFIIITILFILISGVLFFRYIELLKSKIISARFALLGLRILLIFIVIYLLIDPLIQLEKKSVINPKIALFIDNSKSIAIHESMDNIKYLDTLSKIIDWSIQNEVDITSFKFGNKINQIPFIKNFELFDDKTNYSQIVDTILNKNFNYAILCTDGVATDGPVLESIELNNEIPIYTVGIGKKDPPIDIKIKSLKYEHHINRGDSLHLDLIIWSNLNKLSNTSISIKNKKGEIIYNSSLKLNKGQGLEKISINLIPNKISEQLELIVQPVPSELNIKNNHHVFNVDIKDQSESILFLSGGLSLNTTLIKSILNTFQKKSVHHFYRVNRDKWNKEFSISLIKNFDLIILDDLPIYPEDKNLIEIIFQKKDINIPIIYFEGPNSILLSSDDLSQYFDLTIKRENEFTLKNIYPMENSIFNFSLIEIANLPPFKRNHIWINNSLNGNSIFKYADGSDAIYTNSNFTGIFIPDIGLNELKMPINDQNGSILSNILHDMIELSLSPNNKLIKLFTSSNSFEFGERIRIEISNSSIFDHQTIKNQLKLFSHHESQIYPLILKYNDLEKYFFSEFIPHQHGEWSISGDLRAINYDGIVLDTVSVFVQETHIEERQLFQNIVGLKRISENTGGIYGDIHNLKTLISQLSFPNENIVNNIQLSAISTHKFWGVMIILLTLEWILRKRKGLL